MASHLTADHFRRQTRRPQTELPEDMADPVDGLDVIVAKSLTTQTIRMALQQLTEEQQQVLALRFSDGRSIADTAALLDKTETAVKQLQFRAVATLRRLMEELNV